MGFDWKKFAEIAKVVAPVVISVVSPKLTPISNVIAHSIAEAESIPGAKGEQKLDHVKNIASDVVDGLNQSTNREIVSHEDLDAALEHGVNTAVSVINIIAKAKQPSNVEGQPVPKSEP